MKRVQLIKHTEQSECYQLDTWISKIQSATDEHRQALNNIRMKRDVTVWTTLITQLFLQQTKACPFLFTWLQQLEQKLKHKDLIKYSRWYVFSPDKAFTKC